MQKKVETRKAQDTTSIIELVAELKMLEEKAHKVRKKIFDIVLNGNVDLNILQPQEISKDKGELVRNEVAYHLKMLGIPTTIMGYRYLKEGIAMVLENSKIEKEGITAIFYPQVAKKFSSTYVKVEKCIRTATSAITKNCKDEVLEFYFGNTAKDKITNANLITTLVEVVKKHQS